MEDKESVTVTDKSGSAKQRPSRKSSSRSSGSSREGEERPEKHRRKRRDDRKKPSTSQRSERRSRSEKESNDQKESRRESSRKRRSKTKQIQSDNQSCVTEPSVAASTTVNLNESCITETSFETSCDRNNDKSGNKSLSLLDESCLTATSVAASYNQSNNMSFEIDSPHNQSILIDDATSTSHTISNEAMSKEQRAWAGISHVLEKNSADASTVSTSEILPPALIGALRDMKRESASSAATNKHSTEDSQTEDSSSRDHHSMPSLTDATFVTQQTDLQQSMASLLSSANRVVSGTETAADKKPLVDFCSRMIELAAAEPPASALEKQPNRTSQPKTAEVQLYPQHLIPEDEENCDDLVDDIDHVQQGLENRVAASSTVQSPPNEVENVLAETNNGSVRFEEPSQKSLGFLSLMCGDSEDDLADFQPDYDLNTSMPSIATFNVDHREAAKKNASFGDIYSAVALDEHEADNPESENRAFLNFSMTFGQFSTPQLVIPGVDELTAALEDPKVKPKRHRSKHRHNDRKHGGHERESKSRQKRSSKSRRKERFPKPPETAPEQFELPSDQFKAFLPQDEHEHAEQISALPTKRRFPIFKIPKRFGSAPEQRTKDYLRRPTTSIRTRISAMFIKATTTARKGSDETLPSRDEACFYPDDGKPAKNEADNMLLPF